MGFAAQAQQAAALSYPEIDSLLELYVENPAEYGEQGISLALEASKLSGKEDSLRAEYLSWVGYFHQELGDYEEALTYYIQCKDIVGEVLGEEHKSFASSLNLIAILYGRMGDYSAALSLYVKAKEIRGKVLGVEHADYAESLSNLALLYHRMGDYEAALPLYVESKNIREKTLGVDHPDYANSLNNLGGLYYTMGDYKAALSLFTESNDIQEKSLGVYHPRYANSLGNLANLYYTMGDYNVALSLLLRAKDIKEKVLGKDHPDYIRCLNNLASLHNIIGDYEAALPLFIEAKNTIKRTLGAIHPDYTGSLSNLALLYKDRKNYSLAWSTILQSLEVYTGSKPITEISLNWADTILSTKFPSNKHLELTIFNLRTIYSLLEEDPNIQNPQQKQLLIANLALDLLEQYRNKVSNDKDKLRVLEDSNLWLQKSLQLLDTTHQADKAFQIADQNKSVLLLQASQSEKAYQLGNLPDSLIWLTKRLDKEQSQLEAALLEKRAATEKDSLRAALNTINQEQMELEQLVATQHPKYYQLKYQQDRTNVSQIQELLAPQTALLEYVISDSALHIFYVDANNVRWKQVDLNKKNLSKRIKALHQALSDYKMLDKEPSQAYQKYTQQAHWFYQHLLAPILEPQEAIAHLIIIPDGELGHLPFESFLVEAAPKNVTPYNQLHYVVQDYTISYNYSAALWKKNIQAPLPKNNGQILGVAANYSLQLDSNLVQVRLPTDQWARAALSPLPGARKEVEVLQEHYQGLFLFDSLASEKMVKAHAADFAVLHFATHGILDEKRPILSSLALSEDSDSLESNFWQAHEISKLPVNANLVMLSACETGFGRFEQGNGVASLARAFMYAGSPSLVASLWQVSDYATAKIVEQFYAYLAQGMSVDEALQQAKLHYLSTTTGIAAHPAFWSPFIQIGKTTPIALKTKGLPSWIWMVGGGVLLLLGGLVWRRKRAVA
jgi:CHAT domain-containing protein